MPPFTPRRAAAAAAAGLRTDPVKMAPGERRRSVAQAKAAACEKRRSGDYTSHATAAPGTQRPPSIRVGAMPAELKKGFLGQMNVKPQTPTPRGRGGSAF